MWCFFVNHNDIPKYFIGEFYKLFCNQIKKPYFLVPVERSNPNTFQKLTRPIWMLIDFSFSSIPTISCKTNSVFKTIGNGSKLLVLPVKQTLGVSVSLEQLKSWAQQLSPKMDMNNKNSIMRYISSNFKVQMFPSICLENPS